MKVKFWGVRGSIPTPLTSSQFKQKVSCIVQQIRADDLETPEKRELFLAELPSSLFGLVGGNTSCVEVQSDDGTQLIFDAGTGIRELGIHTSKKQKLFHIFFSHFHWDHIQGLPFFIPITKAQNQILFYSPVADFKKFILDQMRYPYFPVTLEQLPCQLDFIHLQNEPIQIGENTVFWKEANHPGGAYGYKVLCRNKKFIYLTDTELQEKDFLKNEANLRFFHHADLIVLDTQYTLGDAIEKYNWGHNSYSLAADFAKEFQIKKLVLFHHEPMYQDNRVHKIYHSAKWYLDRINILDTEVFLAEEGLEITL